jgi:hypothetical protein
MITEIIHTTTDQLDTQTSQILELPRPAVLGIASGVFFMGFFGAYWGFISAVYMNSPLQFIAFFVVGLVTLVLVGIGGIFLKYALSLPKTLSQEDEAESKRIWLWFGIIFGIEFVLIAISSILLSTFQVEVFIAPATALIVGIHFFPLSRLFRVPVFSITGVLLSVLALVALIALLLGLPIAGSSPYNWSLFVGIGTTLVLWLTAIYITQFGFRVMRQGNRQEIA